MSSGRKRLEYVSDFETTTNPEDCRVWGWGHVPIDNAVEEEVIVGHDIESYLNYVSRESSIIYFHNLKFDGMFILDVILKDGFRHIHSQRTRRGEFTTLISRMGEFYTITIHWRNGKKTEFRDSLKKLPMPVKGLAKAFNLELMKGDIDYHADRPIGYKMTEEEERYIVNDVLIVAQALKIQLDNGMTKLTVGADSLHEMKTIMGGRIWERTFPVLPQTMDDEIRSAYRGGFTYADKRTEGKRLGAGATYDVNSLYPHVMYSSLLPYGEPIYSQGAPFEDNEAYPLYITSITFTAKLKKGHIPCIQIKGSTRHFAVEYQTNITDPVTMSVSNVDLELWMEQYDLDILSYNGTWHFRGVHNLFKDFIDKWMEIKATSTGGMRTLAKLQLNSLYGKYASNPDVTGKYPTLEKGRVKMKLGPEDSKSPVYTAMGVFITAYARAITIRAAQANYEHFAYADTDSLHLTTLEPPVGLEIDAHKLGAWKHEYNFTEALFIRPKQYIELKEDGKYEVHIAGLSRNVAETLTFDDIKPGATFKKLQPKTVPGGVILAPVDFTIKR